MLAMLPYSAEITYCMLLGWKDMYHMAETYRLSLRRPVCAGEAQHKDSG